MTQYPSDKGRKQRPRQRQTKTETKREIQKARDRAISCNARGWAELMTVNKSARQKKIQRNRKPHSATPTDTLRDRQTNSQTQSHQESHMPRRKGTEQMWRRRFLAFDICSLVFHHIISARRSSYAKRARVRGQTRALGTYFQFPHIGGLCTFSAPFFHVPRSLF